MALAIIFAIVVACWWFSGKLFAPPRLERLAACKACKQQKQVDSHDYCRECWNTHFGAFL